MRSNTLLRIASWAKLLLVIAASLMVAYCIRHDATPPAPEIEVTAKSDTITLRDTIYVPAPKLADSRSLGFANVTLPAWKPTTDTESGKRTDELLAEASEEDDLDTEPPDSVRASIPIEQRHYTGEDYDAWVSGWNPQLDSLQIYHRQTTITNTATIEATRWRTKRWGLSIGVGVTATPKGGIQPGVFVGASYTFLAF